MDIKELLSILEQYPDGTEIEIVWEGQTIKITKDNIYMGANGVLYLDADNNLDRSLLQQRESTDD